MGEGQVEELRFGLGLGIGLGLGYNCLWVELVLSILVRVFVKFSFW